MLSAAVALLESTKALYDILTSAKGVVDQATISSAVFEVNRKALDLQAQNSVLIDEIHALKTKNADLAAECVNLKGKSADLQRYEMHTFPTGAIAYRLKQEHEAVQPVHYLCTTCYDQSKKSTLQPGNRSMHCPLCSSVIHIAPLPPIRYASTD